MNLNIEVDENNLVWLRDDKEKLIGYTTLDELIEDLKGYIEFDLESFTIKQMASDEELLRKVLFA